MAQRTRERGRVPWWWLVLLAVPLLELVDHAWIVARVPSAADYRAAAAFIRHDLTARDLVVAAPSFIDPILRLQLGDRMPLAMAGRSDDAAYERAWLLSIRGAVPSSLQGKRPELTRQFGSVRVSRFTLGKTPVVFDFVTAWSNAETSLTRSGKADACPLRQGGVPRGGGLGKGVLAPLRERFECDPQRPWLFTGPVVMEDLDNMPRYCLWQHPAGDEPVTMTFHDVPLGDELVFYAGLYYEHERMRQGGPVEASIAIDGVPRGRFVHRDGDGWKRLSFATGASPRGEVSIAVRAHDPAQRSFCWSATTRTSAKGARP